HSFGCFSRTRFVAFCQNGSALILQVRSKTSGQPGEYGSLPCAGKPDPFEPWLGKPVQFRVRDVIQRSGSAR
ncbi:MAG TPA: hypothetical protein PLA96_13685, partial [Candidatus Brocadia sapporoensis]|nr:hypothetical protein [Candidatus Brocadia sapporoensis]